MADVPPWRRQDGGSFKEQSHNRPYGANKYKTRAQPDPSALSAAEILCHYFPTAREDAMPGRDGKVSIQRSTLNGSAEKPKELVFVLLHQNANPQFYTDGVIFVKSQLGLLKRYRTGKGPGSSVVTIDEFLKAEETSSVDGEHGGKSTGERTEEDIKDETGPTNGVPPVEIPVDEPNSTTDASNQPQAAGSSTKITMTADQYLCSIIAEGSPEISTPASTSDQAVAPDSLHDTNPHIAVYNQVQHGRGNKDNDLFLFHGYYRVTGVTFCSPHSVALKDLLKRKWTWKDRQGNEVAKERDMDHWRESFKHEWAELKMEKDEEWEKENGPPKIEKKVVAAGKGRKERGEKKGVNELLKEMRLEGEKGVKVEQPNEVGTDTPKDTALKNTGEMTAGEFNQMHGRERYTVVFNAADGKEVDRTERSKGMVTPEESKEISKLEESKKMVEPSDTRGIVTPEESKEISKPQGSKKMNTTDDSKEAIIPEASKEKLDPGSFKEELDPEASNAVITAEDTKEVIPADKSEGTITIGISSDTFTTESSNAAISAEDSKDAISAEDFKGAVAGEGPKESIIIARGSQETPTIADPKEMAQEGTKD